MGALYRRKKRDAATGTLVEIGPWWMKYYRDGRPCYESTGTLDKGEARRKLKEREGQIASGQYQGSTVTRTTFVELVAGIRQDYALNQRKSGQRLEQYLTHLTAHFKHLRASAMTTNHVQDYIAMRRKKGLF